jgi:hypothetical protein
VPTEAEHRRGDDWIAPHVALRSKAHPDGARRSRKSVQDVERGLRYLDLYRPYVCCSTEQAEALEEVPRDCIAENIRVAADVLDVRDGRHLVVPFVAQEEVVGKRKHGAVRAMPREDKGRGQGVTLESNPARMR